MTLQCWVIIARFFIGIVLLFGAARWLGEKMENNEDDDDNQ
ncbi:MAG: hypothetical protein ACOYN5_06840 [Bacteroidales bacterium]